MARAVNSQAGRLSTRRGRGRVGASESGVLIVIDPDGYLPNFVILFMHPVCRVFCSRLFRLYVWPFPLVVLNTYDTPLLSLYLDLFFVSCLLSFLFSFFWFSPF